MVALLAGAVPGRAQVYIDTVGNTVPGTYASPLNINNVLSVGYNSTGTLDISNGGSVSFSSAAADAYIGYNAGSQGTITVTGVGSRLDAETLTVAFYGIGTLDISNGGIVFDAVGYIGYYSGSQGIVTVTGAGSTWSNTAATGNNLLYIGNRGNGALTISGGGTVLNGGGIIGYNAGSVGEVTVTGAGSTWTTEDIYVGMVGNGTLNILDGGKVIAKNVYVATYSGSSGDINIGAKEGDAAAAPGTLDTPTVALGATGKLVFNHTNDTGSGYTFAPSITDGIYGSGAGSILHLDGTTNLTGNSSGFTGTTTVEGGALLVNGSLGNELSTLFVLDGGTLGGSGTIGGDVTVTDGKLDPGNANFGGSVGVLTITGDLTLSGTSILDFHFGEPEDATTFSPYDDLIVVKGDLKLDGTLNVGVSGGRAFLPGLYHVITYGGDLNDSGLLLGTVPSAPFDSIQTTISGQVNLIYAAGMDLTYWDGETLPRGDNRVEGGNGIWQASGGNDNWTDANGTANAAYKDGAFAVFQGTPGRVEVDNSAGTVLSGGMQFYTSDYLITGGAITLKEDNTVIRVGTGGNLHSAGIVATIASILTGIDKGIEKTDPGTLILKADNTYTGATTVSGGTLSVMGSIISDTTVGTNATLTGSGTIKGDTSIKSNGTLMPGNGKSSSNMTLTGDLDFEAGAQYAVNVGTSASQAIVSGTATLGGAGVDVRYDNSGYVLKHYTILTADDVVGTFNGLTSELPANFQLGLEYDPNFQHVYLNLKLDFGRLGHLNENQQHVADALVGYFNRHGRIPPAFGGLTPEGLTEASGELATGIQQATYDAMTQFMGALTDTGWDTCQDETHKRTDCRKSRRDVWASFYGGTRTTDGNAVVGSHKATHNVYGAVVGTDDWVSSNTRAGLALGIGGTNVSLTDGLGSERSDLFQAGAFVRHDMGAAYLSGALAYGWQSVTTRRTVRIDGSDRLLARFNAHALSARLEGGIHVDQPWGSLTPYAAGQAAMLHLPKYGEKVQSGSNMFALDVASKTPTASRTELGLRAERSLQKPDGQLALRGQLGWAHNFASKRSAKPMFQALPGASFEVNGAAIDRNSALAAASLERRWKSGWSAGVAFDSEFSHLTRSLAARGVMRYQW